ncbi:glycosyltransferase family 4 protein [Candidatus Pelagibacter sp.]|nr:glycosyltransferase family 4 protein [Candidatus Pelagibacter sp.]
MTIAILLPYKENYSPQYAGAVSLFVNDVTKVSYYKNDVVIFGNTESKRKLSKNYVNLDLNKKIFQSTSKIYIRSFLDAQKKIKPNLIEIHNRPNYVKLIKEEFIDRLFLFFHNDPLTMSGSKTAAERIYLLNNLDKIIFNSKWSQDRFFVGLQNKNNLIHKTSICYQSSSKTKIDFKNKKKIISFVGKLNKAKGYDIFGQTIIKILNKHPDWKAKVFGDEPREKLSFKHKNLHISGFKNNNYILNNLKKISISVVCSRWNEPFGRTSLEAASRGSAVIISNKGGLPETTNSAIILEKLDSKTLFKVIDKLIQNKKRLLLIQKKNYSNFIFTHKFISTIIDSIRDIFLKHEKIKLFNISKKNILKIIHITNFNQRFDGRLHYNTGKRLQNGLIRLGHNVLAISDRDIINKNKTLKDLSGKKSLQNSIINTCKNFNADCIILGHADAVENNTLELLKNSNKNLRVCQWFLDPIGKNGPDYKKNNDRINQKTKLLDATFLTTDPSILRNKIHNSFFMPNPCDPSFEILKNYENNCENDVFFAMSHGVHRGLLKKGKSDDRENFINKLINNNKKIKFDIYGMNDVQPVWGDKFLNILSNSSMGINLSRGSPVKYYSSDRIAQLIGNGLLTFINEKSFFSDFIPKNCFTNYKDINDLSYKLNKYKKDRKNRIKIAKNGRNFYLKNINSMIIADFIISKTFNFKSKNSFVWE